MRREWVICASYATCKRRCPWAAIIAKVVAGFIAFESVNDYYQWKRNR